MRRQCEQPLREMPARDGHKDTVPFEPRCEDAGLLARTLTMRFGNAIGDFSGRFEPLGEACNDYRVC
jgi:hypothetical protein